MEMVMTLFYRSKVLLIFVLYNTYLLPSIMTIQCISMSMHVKTTDLCAILQVNARCQIITHGSMKASKEAKQHFAMRSR